MDVDVFCGGMVQTNGYLVTQDGAALVVDAPEGITDWVESRCTKQRLKPAALLVTHGHWDHTLEAAAIQKRLQVPVLIHRDSQRLLEEPAMQAAYSPFYELEACRADRVLNQETELKLGPFACKLLLCPGHCPGSLCFYFSKEGMLFGGDVLFQGAVGRWDLPGGSEGALMNSIRTRILPLPDETRIFPGHGPTTTVGDERRANPFLLGLQQSRSHGL